MYGLEHAAKLSWDIKYIIYRHRRLRTKLRFGEHPSKVKRVITGYTSASATQKKNCADGSTSKHARALTSPISNYGSQACPGRIDE